MVEIKFVCHPVKCPFKKLNSNGSCIHHNGMLYECECKEARKKALEDVQWLVD